MSLPIQKGASGTAEMHLTPIGFHVALAGVVPTSVATSTELTRRLSTATHAANRQHHPTEIVIILQKRGGSAA
jgi:hypothetical protein